MRAAPLSKADLFERLAGGHAAGITVVTPNRRLAQVLKSEFDSFQAARSLPVWDDADILPLEALLARLCEDALYSDRAPPLPMLLAPAQEQAIWEEILEASGLLVVPQAAADCRRAWTLAHAWRIAGALDGFPGNEDARAFAAWAREYARRCDRAGHTDAARLADVLAPLLGEAALRKPKLLVAYAFDIVPPQAEDFFRAFDVAYCFPEAKHSIATRICCPSPREELEAAAQWARAKLEAGVQRIGVVVPGLERRRREVARVFARTLHPAHNLPGMERKALPCNVSLGAPLADYPLVHAALSVLELAAGEIPFEQASRLVRSPFIAGADAELSGRALLDAALRKTSPARVSLGKLIGLVRGCALLRQRLEALFAVPRLEAAPPHRWGRHFSALLEAAGFPGRSLDSDEFQMRAKLDRMLQELAGLDAVCGKMSFEVALARLKFLCRETLFQPESPPAPIQVLGVLESAGQELDALWVSGLTDEAWPLHAAPNPFIPPALQRKAGIPEASPEAALERGQRITRGWLAAAGEVIVSHAAMEGERALIASPLIVAVPAAGAPPPRRAGYREAIFEKRRMQKAPDGRAPALATKKPKGGTRILVDQSACPFRAFARHRLGAQPLAEPAEGLDARARGSLLHALMKALWTELKGSGGLQDDCGPAIERAARAAVEAARLEEPLAGLERKRLARLARDWLEVERKRSPFEVMATEEQLPLAVAGLELRGRIDRMDRLASGGCAVIDYKTGAPKRSHWMGDRPEDPQLPLYALNTGEVSAVAFAKLKTGEMRYLGWSRAQQAIEGVDAAKDWAALVAGWRAALEALGAGFASGDARVDPKKLVHTCRYCELQPLCRVYERINVLEEEGEEPE